MASCDMPLASGRTALFFPLANRRSLITGNVPRTSGEHYRFSERHDECSSIVLADRRVLETQCRNESLGHKPSSDFYQLSCNHGS